MIVKAASHPSAMSSSTAGYCTGDRQLAAAALSAERDPTPERDVLVPRDLSLAPGAPRPRRDDRSSIGHRAIHTLRNEPMSGAEDEDRPTRATEAALVGRSRGEGRAGSNPQKRVHALARSAVSGRNAYRRIPAATATLRTRRPRSAVDGRSHPLTRLRGGPAPSLPTIKASRAGSPQAERQQTCRAIRAPQGHAMALPPRVEFLPRGGKCRNV